MRGHYFACLCVVVLGIGLVTSETLYAASVHWRPSSSNGTARENEIILSYKLIWEQKNLLFCRRPNNGSTCYLYTDGSFPATIKNPQALPQPRWQGYTWRCTGGCVNTTSISDLSALYYTDVGTFHLISWEAAMEMTVFKFGSNDDLANIRIGLFDSSDVLVAGFGEGEFNMAVRNDTGRANISPAIDPLPYYRVPLGCNITISLFPFDGDGDSVRCHWQHNPQRGSILSAMVLNEDKCELHVHADPKKGFKANDGVTISLFAEDFSTQPVKLSKVSNDITTGPFSRTPVLLYLYVSQVTSNCNPGPDFIETGTLPPNSVQSYPLPFTNAKLPFKIPTDDEQIILTSGPRYMGFTENNISDTIEGTWVYINDTSMTGIHQACGMAYTKEGVPGESRCAVLLVNEPNECPCPKKNGVDGICRNLFEYHTCEYPPTQNITCPLFTTTTTTTTTTSGQPSSTITAPRTPSTTTNNASSSTSTRSPTTCKPVPIVCNASCPKRNGIDGFCQYPSTNTTSQQQQTLCRPVKPAKENNDDMGLRVGLPVGLSLLLLIIIIATALYLKQHWANKMRKSSVNPEDLPGKISNARMNIAGI